MRFYAAVGGSLGTLLAAVTYGQVDGYLLGLIAVSLALLWYAYSIEAAS